MSSVLRSRTLSEIVASRSISKKKNKRVQSYVTSSRDGVHELKIQSFSKKPIYNNEDKILLIRYIQKRYRVRFGLGFTANRFIWVMERDKKIIDRFYDSAKRSYFIVRGKITICERGGGGGGLRQTNLRAAQHRYEQVCKMQQGGIGCIFNPEQSYQRCVLLTQNSIILRIDHYENCLMTTQEKELAVKSFTFFNHLNNLNKYYTPYFQTKMFVKGQNIYSIGDQPEYLYLIVDGTVQFQSKVPIVEERERRDQSIAALTLRNCFTRYIGVNTEVVGVGSFFGEEEMIQIGERKQNARCCSITALLLLVPMQKFLKLLYYNELRDIFISTASDRQKSREQTISAAMSLHNHKPEQNLSDRQKQDVQFFNLNSQIYADKNEKKDEKKLSLPGEKIKMLHGNQIKISPYRKVKEERFSMLEVNKTQYENSMKKFKIYAMTEKKRNKTECDVQDQNKGKVGTNRARSLKQVWKVLKLDNVFQQNDQKLPLNNQEGKVYYQAHMRLAHHIGKVKCYRPKSKYSSGRRAKTQFMEYGSNQS